MTNTINEKNIAVAISFTIAVAFVGTTDVHATTKFPPAHTTAEFSEPERASVTPFEGSYYRPASEQIVAVKFHRGDVELAYSSAPIAPYYRTAN
ncbi:MAG: hypothetical protein ACU84Q_19955 [Gammaproteobacteria bacterium]